MYKARLICIYNYHNSKRSRTMTTMITGGTGLMGSRIASLLVARGERPVLLDYAPAMWRIAPIVDKVEVVRGNVENLHEILGPMKKFKVNR